MNTETISITTFQEWYEDEKERYERVKKTHPQYYDRYSKDLIEKVMNRNKIHKDFNYKVVLKGFFPEHDFASRWCWLNIGPCDGKCVEQHSEYPGCPLVLATETIVKGSYKDKNGIEHQWERKDYKAPGEHFHEGVWRGNWLGKTGYDYGYGEFCFKNESDMERFIAAVPTFNFGESY